MSWVIYSNGVYFTGIRETEEEITAMFTNDPVEALRYDTKQDAKEVMNDAGLSGCHVIPI